MNMYISICATRSAGSLPDKRRARLSLPPAKMAAGFRRERISGRRWHVQRIPIKLTRPQHWFPQRVVIETNTRTTPAVIRSVHVFISIHIDGKE